MKPEDELALSFYKEISAIDPDRSILLTEHIESHRLFVKKTMDTFELSVFRELKDRQFPHIPKIEVLAEDDGKLIVIEEFINGQSLEQRLEEGCLTERETARIIAQLCGILQPLHEHDPKIIHRDIKPSNLILYDDRLWLIDFNAAREVRAGRGRDTVLMGTEDYAAPEQFGFSQSTDRTDIYAIGVVMNRLLTGAFPVEKIAEGRLAPIIRRCIEIDPDNRYRSVSDLAAAIRGAMKEGSEEAPAIDRSAGKTGSGKPGARDAGARKILREIPGFRSDKTGRKILAGIGYLLILLMICSIDIVSKDGTPAGPAETVCNWIAMMIIIYGMIFYLGNFIGFRDIFPFSVRRSIPLEIVRILLGAAIIFFLPIVVLVLLYSA